MFIIVAIILIITVFTVYSIIGVLSNKEEDEFQNEKEDNKEPGKIFKWFYSGKHPQQKYYKELYKQTEEARKKTEMDRFKRDIKDKEK